MNSKICCWRLVSLTSAIRVLSAVSRTCVRKTKRQSDGKKCARGERARLYTRRPPRACGGTGRRARLRALWAEWPVEVRILSGALEEPRGCGVFSFLAGIRLDASPAAQEHFLPISRGGLEHVLRALPTAPARG